VKLHESPIFVQMKKSGQISKSPLKETFGSLQNIRTIFIVLFGAVTGQAVVVSIGGYVLYFLTQTLKVSLYLTMKSLFFFQIDSLIANLMLAVSLLVTMIGCFLFGWLSDKIGRKPLVMAGCLLGALTAYPLFLCITHFGNPALENAMKSSPVFVISDPKDCSLQLVPSELKDYVKFTSSCDILKNLLNEYGVPYINEKAQADSIAKLKIGNITISSISWSRKNVGHFFT
jgi:hypothetical protein